jgi:hypothetical protein
MSVFAVWMISPRFAIDGPSLVDDWSAISRSPDQLAALGRFENPEQGRFRPSWIVWNYLQWHTFDAPRGLVGPNVWNVARLLVFVLGMTLMTALMLPTARGARTSLIHAGLAVLPAFTVLAVPKFARDFAWFGPQEPLLLGGLALGGSLLALAARFLLSERRTGLWSIALLACAGTLFWLLGVYEKEVALAAIPLGAAALYVGRDHLRRWNAVTMRRRWALAAIGAVVVIPLVHVGVETIRIALRGDIVYGAEVAGGSGIVDGAEVLYDWLHEAVPRTAQDLMVGAVALVLIVSVVRRRVDVLAVGAVASAALATAFAAQAGVAVSRYYIPLFALLVVALSVSLARLPDLVAAAGVLVVFFAFMPPTETRAEVRSWSAEEQQHAEIVSLVSDLERSGCIVATERLDLETSLALPVLVRLRSASGERPCPPGAAYLVLPPFPDPTLPLLNACAPGRLSPMVVGRLLGVHECAAIQADAQELVAAHRFRSVVP